MKQIGKTIEKLLNSYRKESIEYENRKKET